jgi:outer membrane receptor for ferric coprogen and ferric-rhodotorulic acid
VAGNTTIPGSPAGAIDNLLNWNGDSLKPPFNVTGKSTTDETQYAAYLATRLHATDDLSILLGSRVVDWHRDIEDKPYDRAHQDRGIGNRRLHSVCRRGVRRQRHMVAVCQLYENLQPAVSWVRDINNKPLDPMEGTGYEVGIKGSHFDGKLNSSVALFKIEQDNLAIWIDTPAATPTSPNKAPPPKVSNHPGRRTGRGWQASAGYAYAVSTDADDQRIVTTLPRHSLKTFTSYRLPGILTRSP